MKKCGEQVESADWSEINRHFSPLYLLLNGSIILRLSSEVWQKKTMRLFSGLHIGRESLMAHGSALNAASDNLSNINTPGYKTIRPEFSDLVADSIGNVSGITSLDIGSGSNVNNTAIVFTQGTLDFTERGLDAAITGDGFFVVNDGTNNFYSRAGNFITDPTGNLITTSGESVMGFTTASPDTPVVLNTSNVAATATPTSTAAVLGNIDTSQPIVTAPAGATTFSAVNTNAAFSTGVPVIDSLGERHDVSLFFYHTANLAYTVQAYVDSVETGGTEGTPSLLGTTTMTFGADGTQTQGATTAIALTPSWANGAGATAVNIDLSGFTGFSAPSNVSSATNDGVRPGNVAGIGISDGGVLEANLDNGEKVVVGTLAMASFASVDGLKRVGDNLYRDTVASGTAAIGLPGSNSRGKIQGGALENSNVDPATQFVNVIQYQRGYQAGSQIVQTMNDIINQTIQIA